MSNLYDTANQLERELRQSEEFTAVKEAFEAVQQFLVQRLGASLILNIVLYYLLYIPLKNFALWVQSGISHEKISLRAARRNQGNSYHYR